MTVPGASGGTMAMLLGCYEALLAAAADFFHETRKKLFFLLPFVTGGALGALLMAGRLERLMLFFPAETGGFFAGLVTGGVPAILKKAAEEKRPLWEALWLLLGAAAGMLLSVCPMMMRSGEGAGGRLLAGMLLAAALVLPGISVSAFLYILGLYEKTLAALKAHDVGYLLPLIIGCIFGIFLTARLFEKLLQKFPAGTRYVIAGFLIASAAEAVRALPPEKIFPEMALWFGIGAILMALLPLLEHKGEKHGRISLIPRIRRQNPWKDARSGVAGDLPGENQR